MRVVQRRAIRDIRCQIAHVTVQPIVRRYQILLLLNHVHVRVLYQVDRVITVDRIRDVKANILLGGVHLLGRHVLDVRCGVIAKVEPDILNVMRGRIGMVRRAQHVPLDITVLVLIILQNRR